MFPCGLGESGWANVAYGFAAHTLSQTTQSYTSRLAKEKFEVVNVAATLMTFSEGQKTALRCSTVTFKEPSLAAKQAAAQ